MGTVYRGIDPAINRPVALKTIRLDFVTDPEEMAELKERLHREAQSAGKLSHPNIVTIYDVGSEGNLQYIAMEYLEGQTLEEMIKKARLPDHRQMITHLSGAAIRRSGIVHRTPRQFMARTTIASGDGPGIARVD
jgi:serine/threonine-protein kinase